jgi:hypothetical protein
VVGEIFLKNLRLETGLKGKVCPGHMSEGFRNSKQGEWYGDKRRNRNTCRVTGHKSNLAVIEGTQGRARHGGSYL